jgi:hypothetical protein
MSAPCNKNRISLLNKIDEAGRKARALTMPSGSVKTKAMFLYARVEITARGRAKESLIDADEPLYWRKLSSGSFLGGKLAGYRAAAM